MHRSRPRGFTLLELAAVLGIIGLLSTIATPVLIIAVRRAHSAEARALVEAIADAELAYWRDHGKYLACPPSPDRMPVATPSSWTGGPEWKQLGFRAAGPVHYEYRVDLEADSFKVVAVGDLDGNTKTAKFSLDGKTLELTVTDELE